MKNGEIGLLKFYKGAMKGYDPLIDKWDKPTKRIYEGRTLEGRQTRGFGDSKFSYAGRRYHPDAWTQPMKYIKGNLETFIRRELDIEVDFKFCLCGYYGTDGKGIPHHSDTVPTYNDLVVSLSFGAPRIFQWHEYGYHIKKETNTSKTNIYTTDTRKETNYLMEDGDLFIFDGHSQMFATHSVPDVEGGGERVNLTFRTGI